MPRAMIRYWCSLYLDQRWRTTRGKTQSNAVRYLIRVISAGCRLEFTPYLEMVIHPDQAQTINIQAR
jgi:hypothetical protein